MPDDRIVYRVHAIQRMFQRQVTEEDVREIIRAGEVIESYPNDSPYPSELRLGWAGARPLHVVVARNEAVGEVIVITVYVPDSALWEAGYRRRKR